MGWEYTTIQFDFRAGQVFTTGGLFNSEQFQNELNRLGWEGWELVNVFDTNKHEGATRYVIAVMKRPLTPERRATIQAVSNPTS